MLVEDPNCETIIFHTFRSRAIFLFSLVTPLMLGPSSPCLLSLFHSSSSPKRIMISEAPWKTWRTAQRSPCSKRLTHDGKQSSLKRLQPSLRHQQFGLKVLMLKNEDKKLIETLTIMFALRGNSSPCQCSPTKDELCYSVLTRVWAFCTSTIIKLHVLKIDHVIQ